MSRLLLAAVACASLATASDAPPPPAATADAKHPFVKHVEAVYGRFVAAEGAGDVEAYRATRSKEMLAHIDSQLKAIGKDMKYALAVAAKHPLPLERFRFARADPRGKTGARVSWIGKEAKPPQALVVLFHLEDGAWRVGRLMHAQDDRGKKTPERVLADAHRRLEPPAKKK